MSLSPDEAIACEHRFRCKPRTTVPSKTMHGAFVAESAHEGPFSLSDEVRRWDISDAYERRYWVDDHVFDIRFAVVSDTEILAAFTSVCMEIHEQVRGVARIVVRPGCAEAVLESCVCQTTEQITPSNNWGKSTRTDSVFRGFRRGDLRRYAPLNEYAPLRFTEPGGDPTPTDDWKTLFLPTGYASIALGSVLAAESDIMADENEYNLRVEAFGQRFPIYGFNSDRAWLIRRHAMVRLVDDIGREVTRDREDAKSALSDVSPFNDDILDVIVSMAVVDTKDRVKSVSKSDFVDTFQVGDTPFMLRNEVQPVPDFGGNSLFSRVAIIAWYRPLFDHMGDVRHRESRQRLSDQRKMLRTAYDNANPTYATRYPGYFSYLDRPILE